MIDSANEFAREAAILDGRDSVSINAMAREMQALALVNRTSDEFMGLARKFLSGTIQHPIATLDPIRIYRLVKLPEEEACSNVCRLDLAPVDKIKSLGRLNDIGQQILYASYDWPLVLSEARVQIDEHFGILELQLRRGERFTTPHLGLAHSLHTESAFALGRRSMEIIREEFGFTKRAIINHDLIHSIAGNFMRVIGSEMYPVTIALSRIVLAEQYPDSDGLMYPSILKSDSLNLGIKPEVARLKFKRTRAWRAVIRAGGLVHTHCSANIDDRGDIAWETPNEINLLSQLRRGRVVTAPQ